MCGGKQARVNLLLPLMMMNAALAEHGERDGVSYVVDVTGHGAAKYASVWVPINKSFRMFVFTSNEQMSLSAIDSIKDIDISPVVFACALRR